MLKLLLPTMLATATLATPALAQYSDRDLHRATHAAILSDLAAQRAAEREAKRVPYASPGYGNIRSAGAARDACSAEAKGEAGPGSKILGLPRATTMATGWEVYGDVDTGSGAVPFVCSVRNGSVSGILLK